MQEEPPGAPAEPQQAAVVAASSSSEEEGQSRQEVTEEEKALVAAYAALKKAREALRKMQEKQAGRGQEKAQSSLETFWTPEKAREPPALQDVSPAQTGPAPHWLLAAKQEKALEVVKLEEAVETALAVQEPGSFGQQTKKKSNGTNGSTAKTRDEKLALKAPGKSKEEDARKALGLSQRAFFQLKQRKEGPKRHDLPQAEKDKFQVWLRGRSRQPGTTATQLYEAAQKDWGLCRKTVKRTLAALQKEDRKGES